MVDVSNVEVVLDDLDENDISSLLKKWGEVDGVIKSLSSIDEMLRTKIKVFLKERKWERYLDEKTNISISLSKVQKQEIDKSQLKLMLTENQLVQVTKTVTFEKLSIMTPETRERLKNYVRIRKK